MTLLDTIRMKMFQGYEPRESVSVDWWSGSQKADIIEVLKTDNARHLLGEDRPQAPAATGSLGRSDRDR